MGTDSGPERRDLSDDRLHGVIKATDPYLAVGWRALWLEVVNEVVTEFVSNGPQHCCVAETNLPVLRDRVSTVGFPGHDVFLAVGFHDRHTWRPTFAGIGPATSVESKVRHRHAEALCH